MLPMGNLRAFFDQNTDFDYFKTSVDEMQTRFQKENSIIKKGLKYILRQKTVAHNCIFCNVGTNTDK